MILDELVLSNIGTFSGTQRLNLTPEAGKPIVLVGGLNGCGKTTILEAIQLALYGPLAPRNGRRSGGYDTYLRNLVHRGAESRHARVELAFRSFQEGSQRSIRIIRSWDGGAGPVHDNLEVAVDGRFDNALTSTWNEYVETFLPRGVAGLFFFDGEQIEALADMDRSRDVLRAALAALLGLDLVDRLGADLGVLRRRHRTNQIPPELQSSVESSRQLVTLARQAEESAMSAVAHARVQLERSEKQFFRINEQYRSIGGELLEQRDDVVTKLESAKQSKRAIQDQLREAMAGVAPLLQLASLLEELRDQAALESAAAHQHVVGQVIAERDRNLVEKLRAQDVESLAIDVVERLLRADRESRNNNADVSPVAFLADESALSKLVVSDIPAARELLSGLTYELESTSSKVDDLDRYLATMPDPESVAQIASERENVESDLYAHRAALAAAEEQHRLSGLGRAKAETAYESQLDRLAQANLSIDDDRRTISHIDKVKETLRALKAAAVERHIDRIGALVLEALQQLLRKQSLVSAVKISSDDYGVELAGADGSVISANQLSAGERQLLAVALLWGLARASGQPLPVVIDTPLGRLDGTHRERLLDGYFPHASHQVILLSTDTEIDKNAFQRISGDVARVYRLNFDDELKATSVEPGYFWE
ncbi:DNA sulfur modification protein DndD [Hoyosella rhizosphaerae]|uniref:Nuclease SbcCD subunit C n=1 Tax=Hoyosella rhizosphaerae TaxID=1755582 RepID=A0A916U037_9ACTN|nr:DNA sulfur modification protein DndD [Hoyosella rhizosphaerae]MBN4927162.1 DNA sulfur modification protein DndD [Hoyosella rhizosphaerae]GGC53525.1 hypothetical protein GCM10011410_02350 [Hoyosella rhizosphaerae]